MELNSLVKNNKKKLELEEELVQVEVKPLQEATRGKNLGLVLR